MSRSANSSFFSSFQSSLNEQDFVRLAQMESIAPLTQGRVSISKGNLDGWPSNDVPLVVMYSSDLQNLTAMRRLTQAIGVRFLGYDRTSTLLDALSVLSPVAVIIDQQDGSQAYRLARQILACDYGMTLLRLVDGTETSVQTRQQQVVGSDSDAMNSDGPFVGKIERTVSATRFSASLGRLGILPRRLSVVKA